jgi:hypothetical protein
MSLSLFFIVGSLLSVVVGHSILAQGQIRLSAEEGAIAHAQTVHRHDLVAVARLANPQRIVSEATTKFNMTVPSHVTQVPYVNVTKPLTVSTSQPSATVTPTTNATASTAAQASGAATTK